MAVVGHWVVSFFFAYLLPDASATLFCKLAMLSDVFFGIFAVVGLERAGVYTYWMSKVPTGTQKLIAEWQKAGLWDKEVDPVKGEDGFGGWVNCCFPFYADLSYSHSVEFMAILAVPVVAYFALRWRTKLVHCVAMVLIMISHPLMDMVFHDAYFRMGNRTVTRVSFQLWQLPWNAPFTFALETVCAYGTYRLWLSRREPLKTDKESTEAIANYKRWFWRLSLTHNMFSFYVMTPTLIWVLYHTVPEWGFVADTEWSYILLAVTLWSWSMALLPLYRLESLTVPIRSGDAEAPYVGLTV